MKNVIFLILLIFSISCSEKKSEIGFENLEMYYNEMPKRSLSNTDSIRYVAQNYYFLVDGYNGSENDIQIIKDFTCEFHKKNIREGFKINFTFIKKTKFSNLIEFKKNDRILTRYSRSNDFLFRISEDMSTSSNSCQFSVYDFNKAAINFHSRFDCEIRSFF
jgi:hypothetical protein